MENLRVLDILGELTDTRLLSIIGRRDGRENPEYLTNLQYFMNFEFFHKNLNLILNFKLFKFLFGNFITFDSSV